MEEIPRPTTWDVRNHCKEWAYDSSLFVGFMTVRIYAYKGYAPDLSRQNFLHFGTEGFSV